MPSSLFALIAYKILSTYTCFQHHIYLITFQWTKLSRASYIFFICFPNSFLMLSWFHRLVQNEVQFYFILDYTQKCYGFRFPLPSSCTKKYVARCACLQWNNNIFQMLQTHTILVGLCTRNYIALIWCLRSLYAHSCLLHIIL